MNKKIRGVLKFSEYLVIIFFIVESQMLKFVDGELIVVGVL